MFNFHQIPDDANVIMIANGSGLSAYISMLSTHLKPSSPRRVMLMHGVRHSWDLGYRSILLAMQNLRADFSYLPVISRPQR